MWHLTARREAASDYQNLMKSERRRCPQTANNRAKIDEVLGETTEQYGVEVAFLERLHPAVNTLAKNISTVQCATRNGGELAAAAYQRVFDPTVPSDDPQPILPTMSPPPRRYVHIYSLGLILDLTYDQEPEELRGVIGRTVVPSAYNPSLEQDGPYRRGVLPPRRVELRRLPPRPVVRVEHGV